MPRTVSYFPQKRSKISKQQGVEQEMRESKITGSSFGQKIKRNIIIRNSLIDLGLLE